MKKKLSVQGTVAPGFESIKGLYEHEMLTMAEENTQLCIYYKGKRVVDLWASEEGDTQFSPDSLVNIFSSGKSLAAIAMASLVSRGLLDYDARVVEYWPEFEANGKEELRIADLLRHEGGMAAFNTSIAPENLLTANIKENRVGTVIEGHPLRFPTGNRGKREYHAVTRGWILNEVFRRVDPEGRTIGEYLNDDLRRPLEADAIIGVSEDELGRISRVLPLGFGFQFLESLKPKLLGRRITHNLIQMLRRLLRLIPGMRHSTARGAPPPYKGMKGIPFFNERMVAMGETPSAAANASARGLAKIAAMMAAHGKWEGHEYLSEAAWDAMHANAIEAEMGFNSSNFTQGGVNLFREVGASGSASDREFNVGRQGVYRWMGLAGSLFQWHPDREIGFAFVPFVFSVPQHTKMDLNKK